MAQVKALIGNIKGPAGKDGSANQIYSTDEQVIGKWIDGKSIYKKTMQFSGLHSGENNIAHGIADADIIMVDKDHSFIKLLDKYSGNILLWQLGNSNQSSSNFSQYSINVVWVSNSIVDIYIGAELLSSLVSDLIVTFEYTKTTDA